MTGKKESIVDAAMTLEPSERCQIASALWESVGEMEAELDEKELERILDERDAELDRDPSQELSYSEFMSNF
jgi:putative addiction module component (TIGR02574 family)